MAHTFSHHHDSTLYLERNVNGKPERLPAGSPVRVRDAVTHAELPGTQALALGYLDFTADVPSVDVSGDGGATWPGPFWSVERRREVNEGESRNMSDLLDMASGKVKATLMPDLSGTYASRASVPVNVLDFGAVGDGVADDSDAVEAFFDYLADNGGRGTVSARHRTTRGVVLSDPARGFEVTGGGPSTGFLLDVDTPTNGFGVNGLRDTLWADFAVEAVGSAPMAHGISAGDPNAVTMRGITVTRFTGAPIIFHQAGAAGSDPGERPRDNHIVSCTGYGAGIGNNGFLLESCLDSTISDCRVYGLDLSGSPVFGLQLKNNCEGCHISGGVVDGAVAAVAFGSDATSLHRNHKVSGVIARNCDSGFVASNAENCEVDLQIDMGDRDTGTYPIRLLPGCDNVRVTATVDNIHPSATAAYIAGDDCTVTIPRMNKLGTTMAHFGGGTTGNVLRTSLPPESATYTSGSGSQQTVIVDAKMDTGPRNIASMVTGWNDVGGVSCQLRRVGPHVTLTLQLRGPVTEGSFDMLVLPPGFRPSYTFVTPLQAANATTAAANIYIPTTGTVRAYQATTQTPWGNAATTYLTDEPWPSSLPGSAV